MNSFYEEMFCINRDKKIITITIFFWMMIIDSRIGYRIHLHVLICRHIIVATTTHFHGQPRQRRTLATKTQTARRALHWRWRGRLCPEAEKACKLSVLCLLGVFIGFKQIVGLFFFLTNLNYCKVKGFSDIFIMFYVC